MNIKDKFKKINPKYATFAGFLVPLLMLGAFGYFVYIPYTAKISGLESGLTQMQSEIAKSKVMERKLTELKAANATLQQELGDATRFLPNPEEDAQLQDTVKSMASESGMSVASWTPGQKQKGPGGLYSQTAITVELVGGYHELGHFMQLVDGMQRMLSVTSLDLSTAKLQGTRMSIPVKMTIVAFSAAGGK